jgi:hypothetical protein
LQQSHVNYVADSQTEDKEGCPTDPGCRRGIRIGNAKKGTVRYFIPRPNPKDDQSFRGYTTFGLLNWRAFCFICKPQSTVG